ncbi:MAG: STAS domain-containing protein [Candidatus Solibacter sp.]
MSASASIRHVGNVAIIDLAGRITLNDGAGSIRDAVKSAMNDGHQNILLNMSDVAYIDSAGLGEMSSAFITVSRVGGKLKLLNPQSKVHGMLQVTRLYTIFVTFAEENAAVDSFR